MEVYELGRSRVEVAARRGYLHVVLHGDVRSAGQILHLSALAHRLMARHQTWRLLADARDLTEMGQEPCEAAWGWLGEGTCQQLAWVAPANGIEAATVQLGVTRTNMTALSSGLPVRAFGSVVDAHRWLDARSGERRPSATFAAVRPTERPPSMGRPSTPPMGARPASDRPSGERLLTFDDERGAPISGEWRTTTATGLPTPVLPTSDETSSTGQGGKTR